nr:ribonuclease H-like domain-containing protein [Tanacetum cinerariifolium]
MDLKWQLALLSMRARRVCISPRNQESRPRNQDSSRKNVVVEDTSSKAMMAIDGSGFDWSYMADDEVSTNMALMAFSDSEVYNSKTCSNTCLKSFKHYDNLRMEFNKSEFDLATYKRVLASIKEQLVFYKQNEVVFCDQIVVLKRDALFRDSEITSLNLQIEKLKKEKESNQIKIDNFENASKSLDKLIESQITDNSKTGLRFTSYNVVVPPPTGLFAPPSIDLSNYGLEEFQHSEFKGYGPKDSKSVCIDTSNENKKDLDASIIEDWISDNDEDESEEMVLKSENVQHKNEHANQPRNCTLQDALKDHGYFDSGCSRHMTRNISYLTNFKEHDEGVLFTDTECFVLSPNFKLADESYVLLKVPRKNNMYSFDTKNIVPQKDLTYLLPKATNDESMLWHRFTWLFFLATKEEISRFFKSFITKIENLVQKKVKIIRCDNGEEFKNRVMNEFCEEKGIMREFSMARIPQQN